MSEYMFGVSHEKLSRKEAARRERIAKKHGCEFVEANLPEGRKSWFAGPNRGMPFDRSLERTVMDEVGE